MSSINKVMLIGRLGADPKAKSTEKGTSVCEFKIATSEVWKNKTTGEKEEKVDWHFIAALGKKAELCMSYLKKGDLVYLEGRLNQESWDDKQSGEKKYMTKILVNSIRFLTSKGKPYDSDDVQAVSGD